MTKLRILASALAITSLSLSPSCTECPEHSHLLTFKRALPFSEKAFKFLVYDVDNDRREEVTAIFDDYLLILDSNLVDTIDTFRIQPNYGVCRFHKSEKDSETRFAYTYKTGDVVRFRDCRITGEIVREFSVINGQDNDGDGEWDGNVGDFQFADINDDGISEVIFLIVSGHDRQPRGLKVLNGESGELLWQFPVGTLPNKMIIVDFNEDGSIEILISTQAPSNGSDVGGFDDSHSYLILLNSDGDILWRNVISGEYTAGMSANAVDIDADGKKEIVFVRSIGKEGPEADDAIFIVKSDHGDTKRFIESPADFMDPLVVSDIDNDGKLEFIVCTRAGTLVVYNDNLDVQDSTHFENNEVHLLKHIGDLDKDGKKDVLVQSMEGDLLVLDNQLRLVAEFGLSKEDIDSEVTVFFETDGGPGLGKKTYLFNGYFYEIGLKKKISAAAFELQPYLISAAVILLLLVLSFALVRIRKLGRERFFSERLLDCEPECGILILDRRKRIVRKNQSCDVYFGTELSKLLFEDAGDSPPLIAELKRLLQTLDHSARDEIVVRGFQVQQEGQVMPVDIDARKILNHRRRLIGYCLAIRNSSDKHLQKLAADNIAVGQELMHKIKTLVSVYKNDIYRLKQLEDAPDSESVHNEIIERMGSVADDITAITKGYLALSRLDGSKMEETDLNDLIKEVSQRYIASLPAGITIRVDLDENLPQIAVDREEITCLLENLIENSIKAIKNRGTITIMTQMMRQIHGNGETVDVTEYLMLTVEDNGCGLEKQYYDKVFEPGFSLFPGKVGLGLAIVKRIVENHDGHISVYSEPGHGATFTVALPYRR